MTLTLKTPVPSHVALFPELANATWGEAELNDWALKLYPQTSGPNPLLRPRTCTAFVKAVALALQVDLTFGGYAENRQHLWRKTYLKEGEAYHRGIDYNVPAGTEVRVPAACELIKVVRNTSTDQDWGGQLFFRLESPYKGADYFIIGHLAHAGLPDVGHFFSRGDRVGVVGEPHENGGWFPHEHFQCFNQQARDMHPELEKMDGYGAMIPGFRQLYPDPAELMAGLH
jgi:hypothetical protein